jgi:hypothetical protein
MPYRLGKHALPKLNTRNRFLAINSSFELKEFLGSPNVVIIPSGVPAQETRMISSIPARKPQNSPNNLNFQLILRKIKSGTLSLSHLITVNILIIKYFQNNERCEAGFMSEPDKKRRIPITRQAPIVTCRILKPNSAHTECAFSFQLQLP